MYANGRGVFENHVEGYVGFSIGVANGDTDSSMRRNAKKLLSSTKGCLSTEQGAAGQKYVAELFEQISVNKAK